MSTSGGSNLVRFCVERKVTVAMVTMMIFIFGVISWFRLNREFMPELQFPQLVILTNYPNASSQEVENLVTKVIEESAGTVKNVHRIHSSSREGISIVTVEFLWGTNMDISSLNLREKVDLVKAKLPRDCGEPRIEKFNPFALPVMTLSLSGSLSDKDLLALAKRPVGEILEKTRGVAAVSITGGREREILVELDQSRLTARGLPILSVTEAISRANITYPAGTVKDKTFEYVVRVMGSFKIVQDLEYIVVGMDRTKLSSGLSPTEATRKKQQTMSSRQTSQPITIGALGSVKDALAEITSYSRYDGQPNISISILKQAESNIVRVADEVKKRIPEINAKLPKTVALEVVYDQSIFIKSGIWSMVQDAILGGLLAFLVLFIFLGNWRDALVVSMAIPISVPATFIVMDAKGMSLNTVTLSGLAIGIGMLVDGAIVVQENIARHKEMGKLVNQAAVEGTQEVFGAVTGSILTTVAVFLPFVFVIGVIGQVFRDLSWSVVISQMASLVVAFTVIPLLASRFSRTENRPIGWIEKINQKARKWIVYYNQILNYALNKPAKIIGIAGAACLVSVVLLLLMPRALFPSIEGDQILVKLNMPMGTTLETTNQSTLEIEKVLEKIPDIKHRSVTVGSIPQEGLQPLGSHQAQIVLDLSESRKHSTAQLIKLLKMKLKEINLGGGQSLAKPCGGQSLAKPCGGQIFVFEHAGTFSFMGGQGAPVVIEVKGHDLNKLESVSNQILSKLKNIKGLYNVRTSISEPAPELQLEVHRDPLANLSLSVTELAEAVLTAVHGKVVSKFHEEGKEINIRVRLRPEDREDVSSIEKLYIHSPLDIDVPIGSLAFIHRGQGPSEIVRYDQQRTVMIFADLSGRAIGSVAKDVDQIFSGYKNAKDFSLSLAGESSQMAESFASIKIVLVLSILFIFMIMAAEFESLWQPFLILLTIPLSLIGMTLGLFITGHKLTAMAGMGLILLAGIVVDNGIVLIEFVNQIRKETKCSLKEALEKACHTRLRPILMTALTTTLGMLPLAMGIGQGADMQAPMAVVIVSGLFVSTLLTLVVIPALFIFMEEQFFNVSSREKMKGKLSTLISFLRRKQLPDQNKPE